MSPWADSWSVRTFFPALALAPWTGLSGAGAFLNFYTLFQEVVRAVSDPSLTTTLGFLGRFAGCRALSGTYFINPMLASWCSEAF